MLKNSILIILLQLASISFGQSNEIQKLLEPNETDSLYILAIQNYTKQLDTIYGEQILQKPDSRIIYLKHANYLVRIPKTINGYQLVLLGLGNQKKHFRKNKNSLTLVEVSPLSLKDGLFSIELVPYGAKLKGRYKLNLTYSVWNVTYFRYINGKLVIDKYISGGI